MNILKDNYDPLEYVVSLFNTSYNTHITKNKSLVIIFNIYKKNRKTTQMFLSTRFCLIYSLQFPLFKFFKISKFQMEHSHLILNLI
jgi:hypothetical protein